MSWNGSCSECLGARWGSATEIERRNDQVTSSRIAAAKNALPSAPSRAFVRPRAKLVNEVARGARFESRAQFLF